ncbi:MAG: hypothetical protein WD757_05900 [Actinomycetota bacterium]
MWERSVPVDLEGTEVRIASIPDLIRMKSATDRPLDREDIVALKAILEFAYRAGAIRREEAPAGDDDRASRDNA